MCEQAEAAGALLLPAFACHGNTAQPGYWQGVIVVLSARVVAKVVWQWGVCSWPSPGWPGFPHATNFEKGAGYGIWI